VNRLGWALLPLITFLLSSPVLAQGIGEVTVCWEDGLKPPYLMLDEQQRPTGIAVELLSEVLNSEHIKATHVVRPWKRCLEQVKTNEVTLVPNASFTEERAAFSHYTKPLYETHLVLLYRKAAFAGVPSVKTLDELAGYRVLGISGFNYQRYQGKLSVDEAARNRETQNAMLQAGRGDFAAEQLEVCQYLAKQGKLNLQGLGHIPDPAQAIQPFFVLVSKAHPQGRDISEKIDRGIEEAKKKGLEKKLAAKYL
jgi:polar amino acid transport system substrate-binding protein